MQQNGWGGKMSEEKDPFFDLLCYMATSARGCVDEPKLYGPFRLVDAIERIINIIEEKEEGYEFYPELKKKIQNNKYKMMQDEDEFIEFLDDIVEYLAKKEKMLEKINEKEEE